jgi:hypothetical protein
MDFAFLDMHWFALEIVEPWLLFTFAYFCKYKYGYMWHNIEEKTPTKLTFYRKVKIIIQKKTWFFCVQKITMVPFWFSYRTTSAKLTQNFNKMIYKINGNAHIFLQNDPIQPTVSLEKVNLIPFLFYTQAIIRGWILTSALSICGLLKNIIYQFFRVNQNLNFHFWSPSPRYMKLFQFWNADYWHIMLFISHHFLVEIRAPNYPVVFTCLFT